MPEYFSLTEFERRCTEGPAGSVTDADISLAFTRVSYLGGLARRRAREDALKTARRTPIKQANAQRQWESGMERSLPASDRD